jgi:hypothetical protein
MHETGAVPVKGHGENEGRVLCGGNFLRDAPGKEWDARSPEDTLSFHSKYINIFRFNNVLINDLNHQMNLSVAIG